MFKLLTFLKKRIIKIPAGGYYQVSLSEKDIATQSYKKVMTGGAEAWEAKGRFQAYFLKDRGMRESSKVLDIGCGPGRAAKHLIAFLDAGNYYGIDYNKDFIRAAEVMVEANKLTQKRPAFKVERHFNLSTLDPVFDYALVFSVLNHCDETQRAAFFSMIAKPLKKGAKIYISHAKWFDPSYLENTKLKQTDQFTSQNYTITDFGWKKKSNTFPIIELTNLH